MITIEIINSLTGTDESANYHYRVYVNFKEIAKGKVEGHNRKDEWWKLLALIIEDVTGKQVAFITKPVVRPEFSIGNDDP